MQGSKLMPAHLPKQAEISLGKLFLSLTCRMGKLAKYSILTNIKIILVRKLGLLLLQQNKM